MGADRDQGSCEVKWSDVTFSREYLSGPCSNPYNLTMWTTVFQSVLCLALVHFWIKHRLSYWKRMGVCSVKPKYLLGNMKKFWKRPFCDLTTECYQKLKRKDVIGGFYCFLRPMLILMDPNLIHHVLVKDVAYFSSRGLYHNARDEPETVNLLTIEGHSQKWKELRVKITPTLTDTSKLKPLFDRMAQVGLEFENHVAQLKQGRPIEVRELCSKYAMDVIGKCAFGEEVNSLKDKDNKFRKMGRRLADQSSVVKRMKMIFVDVFGELSRALGVRVVDETSIKFFKRLIADKVEKRKGKDKTSDMINSLLDTDEEEDNNEVVGKLTFEEICAQSLLFFTGHGFEATAATMAWCIYELGKSETVQAKLIDEVDTVLRRREGNRISYEAIQEMTYLDQVLQGESKFLFCFTKIQDRNNNFFL